MRKIASIILLLLIYSSLFAQPKKGIDPLRSDADANRELAFRFGLYGDAAKNYHNSQAHVFCCEDGCGVFGNGTGSGMNIGIIFEKPLVKMIDLALTFGYADRSGDFGVARVGNMPVLDEASGKYVTLQRQHSFTASLPELIGGLGVRFTPIAKFPIYLNAGLTYSLPLSSSSNYEQTEEILAPSGVVYPETHTNFKIVGSGVLLNVKSSFGARGAIGYPLPLGRDITAAPEASYNFPLTKTRDDYQWKIASLEYGVAIRYNIYKALPPPPPPPPEPPPPPPPAPKPEPPVADVMTASPQQIQIVETIVTETFPILPYIFFDSASSSLSNRYQKIAATDHDSFRNRELPHSSLEAYYQILNIVGDRLSNDPAQTIAITGTTDGDEAGSAKEATALAKARAQVVKEYLTSVWGITEDRIAIKTVASPRNPSTKKFDEGIEENRRVEITSDNTKILEPVIHEHFSRYEGTPKEVPFVLKASGKQTIANWDMKIDAATAPLYKTGGSGSPPASFEWKITDADLAPIAKAADANKNVTASLIVKDDAGLENTKSYDVPTTKSRYPFELSRLSLIVFDFDKSDISGQNKEMVKTFVAHSIRPNSDVQIHGSTDRLGELDHNQELSQSRADAVAKLVRAENSDAKLTEVKGIGPAEDASLNSTPEGRYYCRTVTVQVQTPLQ
ncbi:MAG TPA: OmpA family protein [Candidatus Kapabacteria bacterium]|nr:OmpA family protein [Candidatus Kapabacteria bacterium]